MLPNQSPIENTPWSRLLPQVRQAPAAVSLVADPFSGDSPTKPTVPLDLRRPPRPVLPSADRDVSAGRTAGVLCHCSPSVRPSSVLLKKKAARRIPAIDLRSDGQERPICSPGSIRKLILSRRFLIQRLVSPRAFQTV